MNNRIIDKSRLEEALKLLHEQLLLADAPVTELVICGGSALIAMELVARTTRDIDIVAMMKEQKLIDSEPLPEYLIRCAEKVRHILNLPEDWLNNGPAVQFNMGLPEGFQKRLTASVIGERLKVYYISRYDQIFFKTFASADRGGYHIADLRALDPDDEELFAAAQWCMAQDISAEFRIILKTMFQQLGWQNVSDRI